jgi:hypothetical protein
MQENDLFEYAVLRVVPHVEREEFLNVGIVLLCAKQKFLKARFEIKSSRLNLLCKSLDFDQLTTHAKSFELICAGGKEAGPIGTLPIAERFRWLTATRSTILQSSKVHPGLCENAGEKLEDLFSKLVADCE